MRCLLLPILCTALVLSFACAPPEAAGTPAPRFTREQAIAKATRDAKQTRPSLGIIEVRVDEVDAELVTFGEAHRRLGSTPGPGAYGPGVTDDSPVWWVTVRGYLRYYDENVRADGVRVRYVYEADEQRFLYYADTGESLGSSVPSRPVGTTPVPQAVMTATTAPTPSPATGSLYEDRQLCFAVEVPAGWVADGQPEAFVWLNSQVEPSRFVIANYARRDGPSLDSVIDELRHGALAPHVEETGGCTVDGWPAVCVRLAADAPESYGSSPSWSLPLVTRENVC